jgi:hypothetical protein
MSATTKTCTKCGETKPLEEFHLHKKGKFGRHPQCRTCRSRHWQAIATDPERLDRAHARQREAARALRARDAAAAPAKHKPWSRRELEMVADETRSNREIADAIGRTLTAVSSQRQLLRSGRKTIGGAS